MAFRDLTGRFVQHRYQGGNSSGGARPSSGAWGSDARPLVGGAASDSFAIDVSGPAPLWFETTGSIDECIATVVASMAQLEEAHKKQLTSVFGDRDAVERDIQILTRQAAMQIKKADAMIKQIRDAPVQPGASAADQRLRANLVSGLSKKLYNATMAFKKQQNKYVSEVAGIESSATAGGAGEFGGAAGGGDAEYVEGFDSSQLAMMQEANEVSADRMREITNIVRGIEEVSLLCTVTFYANLAHSLTRSP
jgi:hypothetical protein